MRKLALHWQILLGIVIGIIVGVFFTQFQWGEGFVQDWIKPFGTIFINAESNFSFLIVFKVYISCSYQINARFRGPVVAIWAPS